MLRLTIGGRFNMQCRDRLGRSRWRLSFPNGVTTEGVTRLLGLGFGGVSTFTPYVGLIAQSAFSAVAVTDTHSSHPGWSEWTSYGGNRPAWVPQPATGGTKGTLTPFQWVMTANGSLRGAFIASQAAKTSGPGAIIYCTAVASAGLPVSNLDVITCTYTLTIRE